MERVLNKSILNRKEILLLVISITVILVLGVGLKFGLQKDIYLTVELIATGGEWWWGTPPPHYWLANPIQKGAIEYDILRKPLVEILEVVKLDQDNRKLVWIKARLKVSKNKRTNKYRFRQTQLEIGRMINIAPGNISINTNVVGIEGVSEFMNHSKIIVTMKKYSVRPWAADAVQVGDTMKNDKGDIVAEVIDKYVGPAEVTVPTDRGDLVLNYDPLMRDLTVKVKLDVIKSGSQRFFSFYQVVEIGDELFIPLPRTALHMNIIDIEKTE